MPLKPTLRSIATERMTNDKAAKRPPLMSLDEALSLVLKEVTVLTHTEWVKTFEADGRVLSHDLVSGLQVPPQDNSSMDGYACLLYTSPSPRDRQKSRMPSSA